MPEPKVRFKRDDGSDYPAWKEYSISDLFTKIGNKNKDGQNTNVITNSAEFGLIPQRDYFDKDIAVEGNTGNYTIIQTGDFVYNPRKSSYAPMGPFNCYRLEEDGIVSPLYSCLRPKGVLNPEYLLWYFQTDKWYGYVNDHGAQNGARHDRVGMTDKILMGIPVTAPCEEEQQKIADFLSSVDEVITASEEEVANLETQKKAVMKKIFSQEVRFKRADGSDFPEWEARDFKEEADYLSGLTYSPDDVVLDADDGILVLRSSNIQGGVIDYQDNVFVKCKISDNLFVQENDILMCVRNGSKKLVGKTALIKKPDLGHTWGAFMMIIRSHTDNRFIYHYLNSDNFYKQMFPDVNTATIAQITKGMLNDCVIEMPCLEEQRLIANFLSDFDEAIVAAKKELELWKELKKGLLQQMFV